MTLVVCVPIIDALRVLNLFKNYSSTLHSSYIFNDQLAIL